MATPASTQRPPPNAASGPSAPSSRWARSSEPGSAFSGLARNGRGRGSVRGRGGRGGRGGGPSREPKAAGDSTTSDKAEKPPKNTSTPSTVSKPLPPATNSQEKGPATPSTPSSRPKGPARRASKTVPAVVVALPTPTAEAPPSPASSRTQNRRRRSQSGKGLASPLPKINPPAHDDNLLRPNRSRLGPVPHSAPVKDTPPHLAHVTNSFDMRHNIDALVERVRAVAMADNRPSTPGSHIDWAGDDDDSLPDLDDWGVTPAISTGEKHQMMSPIVVDGLKSLPVDPVVKPLTPSPSEKEKPLPSSPPPKPLSSQSPATSPVGAKKTAISHSPRSNFSEVEKSKLKNHAAPQALSISPSNDNAHVSSSKAALHPSLPPKPSTAETTIPPNFRHGPGAAPMRNPSPPKHPSVAVHKSPLAATLAPEEADSSVSPAQDFGAPAEVQDLAHSIHAPSSAPAAPNDSSPLSDFKPREGLAASIHAPQNLLESVSAPSNLSTHASPPTEPRNHNPTHTRAHTVGRPIQDHRDNSRPSRSGYTTPRGGASSGGYHARTHSTPPAGSALNSTRTPHARPVITGDAISRLARTIGNTTVSPARTTVVTTQD